LSGATSWQARMDSSVEEPSVSPKGRRVKWTMRKVFIEGGTGGASAAFWDHAWDAVDLDVELTRLRQGLDPIVRYVSQWVPRDATVLEAGSGSGRVLAFLRELNCQPVGLDFAVEALSDARQRLEGLPMVAGDVTRLPFRDGTFDCVVSLGVVEHFEEGPGLALREHKRVIKKGGLLLLSVPRLNPLKRWVDWRASLFQPNRVYRSWRGLSVQSVRSFGSGGSVRGLKSDLSFYQYEFPRGVVVSALREAGFSPLFVAPTGISFGLRELSLARAAFNRLMAIRDEAFEGSSQAAHPRSGWRASVVATLWRMIGREQFRGNFETRLGSLLQLLSGHMFFVAATARGSGHADSALRR
jgi:SAM-dependent methyltransferase